MKDICGTTGLTCTRCNPGACEHRQYNTSIDQQLQGYYEFIKKYGVDPRIEFTSATVEHMAIEQAYRKGYKDGREKARHIPNSPDDSAQERLSLIVEWLSEILIAGRITIKGMAGEKLIIIDQTTGEEYVVEDLGYPF